MAMLNYQRVTMVVERLYLIVVIARMQVSDYVTYYWDSDSWDDCDLPCYCHSIP